MRYCGEQKSSALLFSGIQAINSQGVGKQSASVFLLFTVLPQKIVDAKKTDKCPTLARLVD